MKINQIPSVNLVSQPLGSKKDNVDFGEMLQSAIATVNQDIVQAEKAAVLLASDEIDVHNAVIMAEKANLALQLTITIRNKIIEAYQEIMRMQV